MRPYGRIAPTGGAYYSTWLTSQPRLDRIEILLREEEDDGGDEEGDEGGA